MIDCDERFDSIIKKFVDEIAIILEAGLVDNINCTLRKNARPTDRKSVKVHLRIGNENHIRITSVC